jgi:serine/threonine protein kinase
VEYLHSLDISHRDLKLENIIHLPSGGIKLIDFGFAVETTELQRTFCGTPTYMAPEIVKRVSYDPKQVDVWAMGIMLFRMLTGSYPFMAATDKELYSRICKGRYEEALVGDEAARDLIASMLRVEGAARITTEEVEYR